MIPAFPPPPAQYISQFNALRPIAANEPLEVTCDVDIADSINGCTITTKFESTGFVVCQMECGLQSGLLHV